MAGLPVVTLSGNLVADPELRFSAAGRAICKLRTASNERRRQEDGTFIDGETCFLTVTVFGPRAEQAAELTKGQRVLVTGRLAQRTWEQDGQRRSDYELKADEIAGIPKAKPQTGGGSDWGSTQADADDSPPF